MILEAVILGSVIVFSLAVAAAITCTWLADLPPTDDPFTIPTSHQGAAVAPSEPGQEPVTLKSGEGRSN